MPSTTPPHNARHKTVRRHNYTGKKRHGGNARTIPHTGASFHANARARPDGPPGSIHIHKNRQRTPLSTPRPLPQFRPCLPNANISHSSCPVQAYRYTYVPRPLSLSPKPTDISTGRKTGQKRRMHTKKQPTCGKRCLASGTIRTKAKPKPPTTIIRPANRTQSIPIRIRSTDGTPHWPTTHVRYRHAP